MVVLPLHCVESSQHGKMLLVIGMNTANHPNHEYLQYIFANLFTGATFRICFTFNFVSMITLGVVVESFYYVFQMTGGAKSITREEMRSFKKVWAEFANPKTGYLERTNFVRFFGVGHIFHFSLYIPFSSCFAETVWDLRS